RAIRNAPEDARVLIGDSLQSAAVGNARRGLPADRRSEVGSAARQRTRGTYSGRLPAGQEDRGTEWGRPAAYLIGAGVHRRRDGRTHPRVRYRDRHRALERGAAPERDRDADEL